MAKQLHFNKDGSALKKMQAGVDKLASVVGITLGPKVWLSLVTHPTSGHSRRYQIMGYCQTNGLHLFLLLLCLMLHCMSTLSQLVHCRDAMLSWRASLVALEL